MEQRTGLKPTPGPGVPGPLAARARSPSRAQRIRRATAIVLAIAIPVAAVAWAVSTKLAARERERVEDRLVASLDAARAELASILVAAEADARGLSRAPAVRRAVIRGDALVVDRLARTFPGLVVRSHGRLLTAPMSEAAHVAAVAVLAPGGVTVGRIGIATRLDGALLRQLRDRAGTALLFESAGRVLAGAQVAAGGSIELDGSEPQTVVAANRRYLAAGARVPGTDVRLVALVPAEVVEEAEDRQLRVVALVALLTLLLLVVAVDALSAVVRRHRRR
ncbi:MAG TPA: hypothetical protein VFR32_00515 [Gaiellaceae bacterium]|nr:hypothetical protein [Gaiellaceae bacterium]